MQEPPSSNNGARKYLPLLWAVNLVVAVVFAIAFLSSSANVAVEEGNGHSVIYPEEGGLTRMLLRYGGMSISTILLQGVMAILNFGVVPFLEPDENKINSTCLKIAFASALLIMAMAVAGLVLGWPKP